MKNIKINDLRDLQEIQSNCQYVIEKGNYTVETNDTKAEFLYLSNNDGSVKNIAFFLDGVNNVVLDFSGSEVTFQGRITPFIVRNCDNITLKNITVLYDRPFFTCGKITEHGADFARLSIDKNVFPYRIENGALIAQAPHWEKSLAEGINLFIEIDNERKRPAYNTGIILPLIGNEIERHPTPPIYQAAWWASEDGEDVILHGDFSFLTGNNRFVITHEERWNCVWAAIDSKNLSLQDVVIRESGAMGALFQNCEDISMQRVCVQAREEDWYLISTNCDATHYVNCRGKIHLQDCVFEHMMDDGGNFHGIYTLVNGRDGNVVTAKLSHFQQQGVNMYKEGDVIEITSPDLSQREKFVVENSKLVSATEILLTLRGDMSFIEDGYVIDNITAFPEILIQNCRTGNNRPRGFLLNSNKKTVVEGCTFYNSDVGIAISGDNSYWFESTGVKDVTIQDNVFDNCGYHCADCTIVVHADIKANPSIDFHSGIKVKNNLFKTFSGCCAYVLNCSDFAFENNEVEITTAYPVRGKLRNPIER